MTLKLGDGRMWGTRAKVWPWMLTSSCVIWISEAEGGCEGGATGATGVNVGSCFSSMGWICRTTGIPFLPAARSTTQGLLADVMVAPAPDACVGLMEAALLTAEAPEAGLDVLVSGSKLVSNLSSASTLNPSCFMVTVSIFSSRNSSISSSVGWNDPPRCSSVSTFDQVKKSKLSSFMDWCLKGSSLLKPHWTVDRDTDEEVCDDSRWSRTLSALELLQLEQERGLDSRLTSSSEGGDGMTW